jgi:Universal stress protein family
MTEAETQLIVAGVDGSESSLDALRWAARQAELTGAELQGVMAWTLPEIYSYTSRDDEGETRKALEGAIEQALGHNALIQAVRLLVRIEASVA